MRMKRKQIYLEPETEKTLSELAVVKGTSEAAIIREAIAKYLVTARKDVDKSENPLYRIVGLGEGKKDGALNHDKYLYGEDQD